MAQAVKRLTESERQRASAALEGWRRVRRAREHHSRRIPGLKAKLGGKRPRRFWPHFERDLCSAEAWVDGIDAAIILYETDGPDRVFEEARTYADSAVLVRDYEYVLAICRKAQAGPLDFSDLPEQDRLRLAGMTWTTPAPSATEAEWASLWEKAQDQARLVFDAGDVRAKLKLEGPSHAAEEMLARLKKTSVSRVRRLRSSPKRL